MIEQALRAVVSRGAHRPAIGCDQEPAARFSGCR